jgi:hypothetical protein
VAMQHTKAAMDPIKAVPKERLTVKVLRSIFGLLFIGGAGLAAYYLEWPWYVAVPVAMFGAHIISAEITKAGLSLIVGLVKDLFAVVKGKNGT